MRLPISRLRSYPSKGGKGGRPGGRRRKARFRRLLANIGAIASLGAGIGGGTDQDIDQSGQDPRLAAEYIGIVDEGCAYGGSTDIDRGPLVKGCVDTIDRFVLDLLK